MTTRRDRLSGIHLPQPRIAECLLFDGTAFFVALLILNVVQIATFSPIVSPASTIVILMPPILANRFLLNLHTASTASTSNGSAADWRGVMSSPLGEIGTVEFRRSCGDIQQTESPIESM
ncbi:hypothetical protein PHLGIDRAFT_247611 [Phlebiopsis gigantea 11061_1 CR5-6]|uniref:Uncharacterized protein n=1 Tax=Phlebiopsis gigantea (strain 11061_1 CR5-6) TaxID=745531 RepID=A0A0C3NF11_PHLG1|nr:hypothetical protein PHLGIDRAFT_247611 [Phlebiopsis gigantea 11061_1 CR5-6]